MSLILQGSGHSRMVLTLLGSIERPSGDRMKPRSDGVFMERAFIATGIEFVVLEPEKDFTDMAMVFFQGVRVDQDVVQISKDIYIQEI